MNMFRYLRRIATPLDGLAIYLPWKLPSYHRYQALDSLYIEATRLQLIRAKSTLA